MLTVLLLFSGETGLFLLDERNRYRPAGIERFDVVVAGGGSAGCGLAARLGENADHRPPGGRRAPGRVDLRR